MTDLFFKKNKQSFSAFLLISTVIFSLVSQQTLQKSAIDQIFENKNVVNQLDYTAKMLGKAQNLAEGSSKALSILDVVGIENPLCGTCRQMLGQIDDIITNKTIEFVAEAGLSYLCGFYLTYDICWGFAHSMGYIVLSNLANFTLSPNFFCEEVIPVCRKGDYELQDHDAYVSRILADKPEEIKNDDFVDNLYTEIAQDQSERKTLKFVHFSDLHLDLDYTPGASIACPGQILGCRPNCGYPSDPSQKAPLYGAYGCDVPLSTFQLMNKFINTEIKPDVIFWTGDIVPHDQWNYDVTYVERYQNTFTQQILLQFPNTPFHPIHGNHDFGQANSQDFRTPDPMLQFNINEWKQWLDPEAQAIYAKAGYYTQKLVLGEGYPTNVRLIALNTQSCYIWNFYLWSQRNDPGDQLAWLEGVLAQMEKDGEVGIIFSHIPPGDQCLYEWTIRYKALIERYQHLIRLNMHGHVHTEEYGVFRSFSSANPIGVNYWTGAISSVAKNNPNFRVFEVDAETLLPVKAKTYIFDFKSANPQWQYHHELTEYYNMKDLSPSSFDTLSAQIKDDETIALKYLNTKLLLGKEISTCDADCRLDLYCHSRNSVYFEGKDCKGEPRFEYKIDPLMSFAEKLSDPWYLQKATAQTI